MFSRPLNSESSASDAGSVRIVLRTPNVILLSTLCAWTIWWAVWMVHPSAYEKATSRQLVEFLIFTSGPFLAGMLSLVALQRRSSPGFWTRFVIEFAVTACFIILWMGNALNATDRSVSETPLLLALALLAAKLLVGLIGLVVPDWAMRWERERWFNLLIVASVVGPLAGLYLWSGLNISLVTWRAAAIAGSDPYCLQVPSDSVNEKQVTRRDQLSGLWMQTPYSLGGMTAHQWQFSFHCVLVVKRENGNKFYNWSYYSQNFIPISERTERAVGVGANCQPKPDFVYTLAAP